MSGFSFFSLSRAAGSSSISTRYPFREMEDSSVTASTARCSVEGAPSMNSAPGTSIFNRVWGFFHWVWTMKKMSRMVRMSIMGTMGTPMVLPFLR